MRRLRRVAEAHAAAQSWPEVRKELIDTLLHLRVLSLDVVDAIESWRHAGGRPGASWPDPQTGENYLLKMKDDTRWVADSPLGELLKFSAKSDPFFVVPSTADRVQTPTNQMTPALQARRSLRSTAGAAEARKAVLPLQSSLLRRIRAAELCIVKESVQARVQQQAEVKHVQPFIVAAEAAAATYGQQPRQAPTQPLGPLAAAVRDANKAVVAAEERPPLPPAPARPRPGPPPEPTDAAFQLQPVGAGVADIEGIFARYIARVDDRVARSLESAEALQQAAEEDGPEATEWFWLVRSGGTAARPTAETADGLCVFRVKRMSTTVGLLLHLSVTDFSWVEDALESVKERMFSWLPIRSIRVMLWYCDFDGELQMYKDFEACFKEKRFRWFQLTNVKGKKGQVMNCNRYPPDPPDYAGDPETPAEEPAVEVCLGQAWLLGGSSVGAPLAATRRRGACPGTSLVLAGACLRQLWTQAATAAADAVPEVAAKKRAEAGLGTAPEGSPAALAASLATTLEAGPAGRAVPGVLCESASENVPDLLRRGIGAQGFAEAAAGLGADDLPEHPAALAAREGLLGRLYVTMDWVSVRRVAGGGFEVPVHAAGLCSKHPHPVFYLATTEDDVFVVVIPWEGLPQPSEDSVFSSCTGVLRSTSPQETPPFKTVGFASGFEVRSRVRTSELEDAGALGITSSNGRVHVAEFASLCLGSGRPLRGGLAADPARTTDGGPTFSIRRPFAVCVFHTGIDDLDAPLTASMVA